MIYNILLYTFALIGVLVTGFAALVFLSLSWAKWLAKQKLKIDARVDAQRRAQA